jgi:hypothetical protein
LKGLATDISEPKPWRKNNVPTEGLGVYFSGIYVGIYQIEKQQTRMNTSFQAFLRRLSGAPATRIQE